MYREMKSLNKEMAKKFLVKEREVGKMLALLTVLFFLVYLPNLILRAVILIFLYHNIDSIQCKNIWNLSSDTNEIAQY